MTVINAAAALTPYAPADMPDIFTMSNGALVVFLTPTGSSWEQYAVSTDSGATWTTKTLPNFPGTGDSHWLGMATASCYVQDLDLIHSFSAIVVGGSSFSIHRAYAYDTSLNVLAGGSGGGYSTPIDSTWLNTGMSAHGIAVDKAGSGLTGALNGYWFGCALLPSTLLVAASTSDQSFSTPAPATPVNLSYFHNTIYDFHLRYQPGSTYTVFLTMTDDAKKALIVIPLVWNAGTGLWNNASYTPEIAYRFTGTDIQHTPLFDGSGNLDLIIRDGSNLYAVKRTGTNAYTGAVPLYPSVAQSGSPAVSYDSGTGNAVVVFRSTINQANGEIYAIKRTSGVWSSSPALLAGGNADGYSDVLVARTPTGAATPAICQHGAGVDYIPIPLSGAPFTPTVSAPIDNTTTATPILRAPYVNPSPTDPIGFQQWQVIRTSDSVSFWDSGSVATTVPFLLYAGTTLVFGTQYQARVRYADSISAGGAGTYSGWSTWQTFTPVHGPIGTITSIVAGTTISSTPGTLTQPLIIVHFTYTQTSSDAANSYRLKFYAADAVTLLYASPAVPGAITAGASVVTFPTLIPGLLNSTVYYCAVETTDDVTGIVADGPQWQLTTAWAPPTTPGSFTVTPNSDLGTVAASWTIDGSDATVNFYFRATGTTAWTPASQNGTSFTSLTIHPPPQTPYDYKVTGVSSAGVESAAAEQDSVTMGGRGTDEWSVILRDLEDPTLVAWMGASDTWDDLMWTPAKDRDAYLPLFAQYQKSRWGVEEWETANLKFYLIGQYWLKDGSMSPLHQDALNLRQMYSNARFLQYLDPRGRVKLVEMTIFSDAPADDFNDHVQFTLEEMGPSVVLTS